MRQAGSSQPLCSSERIQSATPKGNRLMVRDSRCTRVCESGNGFGAVCAKYRLRWRVDCASALNLEGFRDAASIRAGTISEGDCRKAGRIAILSDFLHKLLRISYRAAFPRERSVEPKVSSRPNARRRSAPTGRGVTPAILQALISKLHRFSRSQPGARPWLQEHGGIASRGNRLPLRVIGRATFGVLPLELRCLGGLGRFRLCGGRIRYGRLRIGWLGP